jgi:nanoRNase/pAp phosphatase (c-di-AMP/oligoRNAs hydrolase)
VPTNQWDCSRSDTKLKELQAVVGSKTKKPVLILAHNNPDPDCLASAAAFQLLLKDALKVKSVIGYGGMITRAENQAMVHRLRIKLRRISRVDHAKYTAVALLDCQPGTGNNLLRGRAGSKMIVIDHHPLRKATLKAAFHDIRPAYGATSTILTEYLIAAGLKPTRSVANALLYGIKTDTNSLVRTSSEYDFKAFKYLSPLTNPRVLGWIEKPSLSIRHFVEYHRGLSTTTIYRDAAICWLEQINSEAAVPRLADDLLRIDGVSWSLCMGRLHKQILLSIRTTSRSQSAGSVIRRLVAKAGSAGGHRALAGGQIPLDDMKNGEVNELVDKLILRFLKLIKREGVNPKPLVELDACLPNADTPR